MKTTLKNIHIYYFFASANFPLFSQEDKGKSNLIFILTDDLGRRC